jgi:VanZ family protein
MFMGSYFAAFLPVPAGFAADARGASPYNPAMNTRGPVLLARYLALAWLALVIYGSLHPFSGWRDTGLSPFTFLEGGWPRYWTAFDLAANVAVYLPLGFLLTLALRGLPGRFTAPVLAVLLSATVSLGLEVVQTWLPSRVPSNVDLACNALGGFLGAIPAQVAGPRIFVRFAAWQKRLIAPIPHAELGLTLLGLWLLIPLSPEILLFGAGDLRQILGLDGAVPFAADSFVMDRGEHHRVQRAGGRADRPRAVRPQGARLCRRAAVHRARSDRAHGRRGDSRQSGRGLRLAHAGGADRPAARRRRPGDRHRPAGDHPPAAGGAGVAGRSDAGQPRPAQPYSAAALAVWRQGHFLNFNGLTRWTATLWPFLTLPFLLLTTRRP